MKDQYPPRTHVQRIVVALLATIASTLLLGSVVVGMTGFELQALLAMGGDAEAMDLRSAASGMVDVT